MMMMYDFSFLFLTLRIYTTEGEKNNNNNNNITTYNIVCVRMCAVHKLGGWYMADVQSSWRGSDRWRTVEERDGEIDGQVSPSAARWKVHSFSVILHCEP